MKKLLFVISLITMVGVQASAQVESRIYPEKDANKDFPFASNEKTHSTVIEIPKPEVTSLKESSKKDDSLDSVPLRVGIPIDVNYSLTDGKWEKQSSGRLWSMTIESEGAISMAYIFSELYLPEGALLYILNQEETMLYGPVTSKSIVGNRAFMTNIIDGSNNTIYLYEPYSEEGKSRLILSRVLYGLVGNGDIASNPKSQLTDCHLDVACVPGWNLEADATGYILTDSGNAGCGALLMTTNSSYIRLFSYSKTCHRYSVVNNDSQFLSP